jgi:zona occludens toxin (predicted ATPase)
MKKVMFLMAVAGMFAFASCKNNAKTEAEDSTVAPTEQMAEPTQPTVDSAAMVDSTAAQTNVQ